jgi:signal transduction histidine kinase
LLDSVISINRMKLDRQSIKLTRDYGTSEKVFGFASEVRQVFANLVLNAIEAMPQGGEILVRARYHANGVDSLPTVRISVADNGVGISPEHREQLFQPFFTTKPTHGNGLGLWVSRGIMEKHGGSIKVKSCTQRGHSGTVFSVSIPVGTTPLRKQSVA